MSGNLQSISERSWSGNLLVQSEAITLVERIPSGSVALVYIDPPPLPEIKDGPLDQNEATAIRAHLLDLVSVLQQARRCLARNGNLFFHSAPQNNGRVRLLLDQVFGQDNFRQEIIVRSKPRCERGIPSGHETIFHYSVTPSFVFNLQRRFLSRNEIALQFAYSDHLGQYRHDPLTLSIARPAAAFEWNGFRPPLGSSWKFTRDRMDAMLAQGRLEAKNRDEIPSLKCYLSKRLETDIDSVWEDISLRVSKRKRVQNTQQLPYAVLDRLVKMGSNPNDLILDPYCGSGTALVAAEKMRRRWIGGDNSPRAIAKTTQRLHKSCGAEPGKGFMTGTETQLKEQADAHAVDRTRVAIGYDGLSFDQGMRLVRGQPVIIEEDREYEFKEVKTWRVREAISNTIEEYAVAFLNSDGGKIFWGIRDSDRVVVGVTLNQQDRDLLRQVAAGTLGRIRPAIDPTDFRLEIYQVESSDLSSDLVVVELVIPRARVRQPYYTEKHVAHVRLDGVTRELVGPELTEWIRSRLQDQSK